MAAWPRPTPSPVSAAGRKGPCRRRAFSTSREVEPVVVVQTRMMRVLDVVPRDRLPRPPRLWPATSAGRGRTRAKLDTIATAAAFVRDRLEKETRP